MVAFGPFARSLVVATTVALVLALSTGGTCDRCASMNEAMDCCAHGPEPPGAGRSCASGEPCSPERSPTAADLSAPTPVLARSDGLLGAPGETLRSALRGLDLGLDLTPDRPHRYLLDASFLI
jgi:hypothetical protein